MSKLAENIKAVRTDTRVALPQAFGLDPRETDVLTSLQRDPVARGQVYRIGVSLGAQAVLSDLELEASNGEAVRYVEAQTKAHVIEYVFGEFRGPLYKLRHALWSRDYQKAEETLRELEQQMFG